MTIHQAVKLLIKELDLSSNSFAKKLNYKRSQAIYDIVSGKSSPSYDFFKKLADSEFGDKINFKNLIKGEEPFFLDKKDDINININITYNENIRKNSQQTNSS